MKKVLLTIATLMLVVALSVTAFADNFVPSVERVALPEVIEAYFDNSGVKEVVAESDFILSSLEKTSSPDRSTLDADLLAEVEEADVKLADAYEEILDAPSLFAVFGTDVLSEDYSYVISHLFDLTVRNSAKEFEAGKVLVVEFDIDMPEDAIFHVATLCEDEWVILDDDQVVNNGDGTVTVTFEELCPIAVIRNTGDADEVKSPQTSDTTLPYLTVAAVIGLAGIAVLALGLKKIKL